MQLRKWPDTCFFWLTGETPATSSMAALVLLPSSFPLGKNYGNHSISLLSHSSQFISLSLPPNQQTQAQLLEQALPDTLSLRHFMVPHGVRYPITGNSPNSLTLCVPGWLIDRIYTRAVREKGPPFICVIVILLWTIFAARPDAFSK